MLILKLGSCLSSYESREFMRGLVFTEFFDMVESIFGPDMVDYLIENTQPASQGAYTAVGNYDYAELAHMIKELSRQTGTDAEYLLTALGKHLGAQFARKFPQFFEETGNTLDFIKRLDKHIHFEISQIYPEAQLPKLKVVQNSVEDITLIYKSERPLADLAHGLILQVSHHFNEQLNIKINKTTEKGLYCCTFNLRVSESEKIIEC